MCNPGRLLLSTLDWRFKRNSWWKWTAWDLILHGCDEAWGVLTSVVKTDRLL